MYTYNYYVYELQYNLFIIFYIYFYRTALQFLFKATELARSFNYYDGGLSHTWMTFYQAQLTDDGVALNEWLDISLSLSLCLCLSVSVSVSLCLSFCLSPSLSLSFFVCLSLSVSVFYCLCLCLSVCRLSFLSAFVFVPLSPSPSLCLSLPLPLSIHHSTLLLTITRYMYLLLLLLLGGYKVLYSPSVLIPLYTMISVASLIGHYCKYMYMYM